MNYNHSSISTPRLKKASHFFNVFGRFLAIFSMQHCEETWRRWLWFWPPNLFTVAALPSKMWKS